MGEGLVEQGERPSVERTRGDCDRFVDRKKRTKRSVGIEFKSNELSYTQANDSRLANVVSFRCEVGDAVEDGCKTR